MLKKVWLYVQLCIFITTQHFLVKFCSYRRACKLQKNKLKSKWDWVDLNVDGEIEVLVHVLL